MIPDFVLYMDPITKHNLELFVVEVKKKGTFSNGCLENNLVKLGKELQFGPNKLVEMKVANPVVTGMLVAENKASIYTMDLKYPGQYRMILLGEFYLLRDIASDVVLLPVIMEKMNQLQVIIKETFSNVYKALHGERTEDLTAYMRKPCGNPVNVAK